MSWLKSISSKLKKTSSKISLAFTGEKADENTLDNLEESLIMSDVGMDAISKIMSNFSKMKFTKGTTVEEIKTSLSDEITSILLPYEKPLLHKENPHIVLMCGVNGNGKTTTIGKLASQDIKNGKRVILAACDTFRAAAIDQLGVWASRIGAKFITGTENEKDPASVAYKAVQKAKDEGFDVVYIDTAGRLQNNNNLMAELGKINRAMRKLLSDDHYSVVLVIDGTTGQNALSQVENFNKMVDIDGLIVTKLDGTAKAGILIAVVSKHKKPIHYIGLGESIEDLQEFNAKQFASGLVGLE